MRLLIATPFLPHSASGHGGGTYMDALLRPIARAAELALVSFATDAEIRAGSRPCEGIGEVRLVARPTTVPRLTMLSRWGLRGLPVAAAKFASETMAATLRDAAARFAPDVCLVEMSVMAQFLPVLARRGRPTILTDHEAGAAIPAEVAPLGSLGRRRDARLWERYVARYYAAATALQALNDADAGALSTRLGRPVDVRPPVVTLPETAVDPAAAPPRALFLGDYTHHPNPEAATFLARELWPRVRDQVADAELWLAGPDLTEAIAALGACDGVRVLGFVDDLPGLLGSVRCLCAPLFSGAGTRIKVLTALAHGLPVVSNALGLRGVDAPTDAARRGETVEELRDATVALLRDAGAAAAAGRTARAWAEHDVSAGAVADLQIRRCRQLVGR